MLEAIVNLILNLLKPKIKPKEIISPIIRRELDSASIVSIIEAKFPELPRQFIFMSDKTKQLCDIEDIEAFLEQDRTNHIEFIAEKFDCDDFTFRLMGQFSTPEWASIAKGIVWSDKHALMAFIDTNLDFWYLEPQNDKIQSKLENWQGSEIRVIIM